MNRTVVHRRIHVRDLLAHIEPSIRGRMQRVLEPGSAELHQVRSEVLQHRACDRTEAVNFERKERSLAPVNSNVVRRVCFDPGHVQGDSERPKRIIRRRRVRKTKLDEEDCKERLEYTHTRWKTLLESR
jgi:hypothetical protein